jgi:putative peptidoglycan lipid II flippase
MALSWYYNGFLMVRQLLKNGSVVFWKKQTSVMAAAALIMASYGVSMLLGVVRNRLLVTYFYECCSGKLDVYYAAFRWPDMVFQLVVIGALSAAFIPVISGLLDKEPKEAMETASTIGNLMTVVFLVLGGLVFVLARPLSVLITGSFSPAQISLMVQLTRLMLVAQFFFLLSNLATGLIQSYERFLVPALAPLVYNLGIITGILLLSSRLGIYAPAIGVVIGALGHFVIQVPLLWRLGFRYLPVVKLGSRRVREIIRLMIPRTVSLGVSQIEVTAAVWFATSLSAGSLTIFTLASQIMQLPVRLVGTPVGQASLPSLSKQEGKERQEFRKGISRSVRQILYLVLPATAVILVLRVPIVRIAYGARSFPWQATLLTSRTLAIFCLAVPAQAVVQMLVRGFWARKDTRTPLWVGLVSVVIYLLVNWWVTLRMGWGVLGLATATVVSSSFQALALGWGLYREWPREELESLAGAFLRMLLATGVMGVCLWGPMRFLDQWVFDTTRVVPLVALTVTAGLAGLAVYVLLGWWLKLPEQRVVYKLVGKISQARKLLGEAEEVLEAPVE